MYHWVSWFYWTRGKLHHAMLARVTRETLKAKAANISKLLVYMSQKNGTFAKANSWSCLLVVHICGWERVCLKEALTKWAVAFKCVFTNPQARSTVLTCICSAWIRSIEFAPFSGISWIDQAKEMEIAKVKVWGKVTSGEKTTSKQKTDERTVFIQ